MLMTPLSRPGLLARVEGRLCSNPAVLLLGPRQCGKTTLAKALAARRRTEYFDLEAPADRSRLAQPATALGPLRGTVVIDEAQLQPEIFPLLRVLADRRPLPARFLLLGSASPDLVRGISESLAGRVALVQMSGFSLEEVGVRALRRLWWRGGFPRSFLARSDEDSRLWREDFVQTFLERDLRRFGVQVPALTLRRLWSMVAHYHGQIWNASEIGRSLGEAHTTVRRHLDVLCGAFVVRQLPPWFENLGKRQISSALWRYHPGAAGRRRPRETIMNQRVRQPFRLRNPGDADPRPAAPARSADAPARADAERHPRLDRDRAGPEGHVPHLRAEGERGEPAGRLDGGHRDGAAGEGRQGRLVGDRGPARAGLLQLLLHRRRREDGRSQERADQAGHQQRRQHGHGRRPGGRVPGGEAGPARRDPDRLVPVDDARGRAAAARLHAARLRHEPREVPGLLPAARGRRRGLRLEHHRARRLHPGQPPRGEEGAADGHRDAERQPAASRRTCRRSRPARRRAPRSRPRSRRRRRGSRAS